MYLPTTTKAFIVKILFIVMLIVIPTNFIVSKFIFELLLSEIFIGIFIFFVLGFYYKKILFVFKKYKTFLILSSLFIFSLFMSSALSIAPRFSLIKWFEFYFSGLLFAISFLLLLENGFTKAYFLKTVVKVGMFYSIMGIIESLFHNELLWFLKVVRIPPSIGDYPKIAGVFEWHTVFGSVMAFNSIISLVLYVERKISGKEFILSEILFIIGIVLSTSRNAVLTMILGITLLFFINRKMIKITKKQVFLYGVIFLVGVVLVFMVYKPAMKSFERFSELVSGTGDISNRLNSVGSGRITIIKFSIRTFLQHTIFGTGIRVFPYYSKVFLHTHNIFLQFLVEGGVIGFLFFMILLSFSIINIIKKKLKIEFILLIIFLFNQSFGYFVGHIYYFVFYMWFLFTIIYRYE